MGTHERSMTPRHDFGLSIWGEGNFVIQEGEVCIHAGQNPSLLSLTQTIRDRGLKGPLLLRFPHLIRQQIDRLFSEFDRARDEFGYQGAFRAVFPLKVNQFPNFIDAIMAVATPYHYGLEAGSKAELIIALAKTPLGSPITINGFKDREMIALAFIGAKSGHNITITIEGLTELETIIEVYREFNPPDVASPVAPHIGVRIRLHSSGVGIWAKSGGINSKFGLTSTELLEAVELLKKNDLLQHFTMIHFHIGSQIGEINPVKKALREAGNIYAELKHIRAHEPERFSLAFFNQRIPLLSDVVQLLQSHLRCVQLLLSLRVLREVYPQQIPVLQVF